MKYRNFDQTGWSPDQKLRVRDEYCGESIPPRTVMVLHKDDRSHCPAFMVLDSPNVYIIGSRFFFSLDDLEPVEAGHIEQQRLLA